MASVAMVGFSAISAIASAMPAVSTVAGILGGVATAGSVLMGMQQARQHEVAGQIGQQEALFKSKLALLEGERQANASAAKAVELRRDAVRRVAAARVAFAGSGIDLSSGQLRNIEGDIENELDYGLKVEDFNTKMARGDAALRASQLRMQGVNIARAGKMKADAARMGAAVRGAQGLLSIIRRG